MTKSGIFSIHRSPRYAAISTALDKGGQAGKVFGGAVEANQKVTAHRVHRCTEKWAELRCQTENRRICAASLIEPDDFVFLDAGTTTAHMIDFIRATSAKVWDKRC